MGLTKWLEQKLMGDSEERRFRKQVNAEAKNAEKEAFHEAYKEKAIEAAKERGTKKAELLAQKKSSGGGGGIMSALGKLGEIGNAASNGLVKGIEINPEDANQTFDLRPPERTERYGRQREYPRRRNRRTEEVDIPIVKDPFDIDDY